MGSQRKDGDRQRRALERRFPSEWLWYAKSPERAGTRGERIGMHPEVPEAAKEGKDKGGEGDQWTSTSWVTGTLEGM